MKTNRQKRIESWVDSIVERKENMENLFDTNTDYEEVNDYDNSDKCPDCGSQLYYNNDCGHRDCLECGYWGN